MSDSGSQPGPWASSSASVASSGSSSGGGPWGSITAPAALSGAGHSRVRVELPAGESFALASHSRRAFAKLVDVTVLVVALVPGSLLLRAELTIAGAVTLAIAAAVILGLQWRLITRYGQSLGKRLTGLRIVTRDGERVGFLRGVLLREIVMTLVGVALGGLPLLADPLLGLRNSRRCLHDLLAGTQVILAGTPGDPY